MDEIFNTKPWITPIRTLDSNNPSSSECNDSGDKEQSSCKTKKRPTRKYYYRIS
jgi:hypothetical protein